VKVGAGKSGLAINGQEFAASPDEAEIEQAPSKLLH
jgi:hypothetical protein